MVRNKPGYGSIKVEANLIPSLEAERLHAVHLMSMVQNKERQLEDSRNVRPSPDLVDVRDVPHRGEGLLRQAGLQEDGPGLHQSELRAGSRDHVRTNEGSVSHLHRGQEPSLGLVVGLELGHVLHPLLLGDGPLYRGRGGRRGRGGGGLGRHAGLHSCDYHHGDQGKSYTNQLTS